LNSASTISVGGLVEPRVHARGDLDTAGEGEPDVHAGLHAVGGERAPDLLGDLLVGRDLAERQRPGRGTQPSQVLVQPEDPPVVQPEPLPDRVAALDGRVERAYRGAVAVGEPAAHVDDQIAVALIGCLQHRDLRPA
jgi:hypothetical protein